MNFIEKIQKINKLSEHLLKSGNAKDRVEAQKMAEKMIEGGPDLSDFNKDCAKTNKTAADYGEVVKKNNMRQPPSVWK